jgi:hypothetical protein
MEYTTPTTESARPPRKGSKRKRKENEDLNPESPKATAHGSGVDVHEETQEEEWAWTTLADSTASRQTPVFTADRKCVSSKSII